MCYASFQVTELLCVFCAYYCLLFKTLFTYRGCFQLSNMIRKVGEPSTTMLHHICIIILGFVNACDMDTVIKKVTDVIDTNGCKANELTFT